MLVVLAGSAVQSALGFGTTMITMGFLPLIMVYSKAMGISIAMVSISTLYVSAKYRDSIRWGVMLPFLIPTAIITGLVNFLSAKVSSEVMYLLLGFMFVARDLLRPLCFRRTDRGAVSFARHQRQKGIPGYDPGIPLCQ